MLCIFSLFLSILSFLFLPSCPVPSLLFAFPVSILLSNSPAITVLSCSSSYSQALLTFNPCPVSCCLSCLLLSVLSPDLSVTPYLFCQRNSIQTYNAIYSPDFDSQVFLNRRITISLSVLAERPVQEVLSCYPVLGILSLVSCAVLRTFFSIFSCLQ